MKQIQFNYEGTTYTLEYTRRTVEQMERNGFDVSEFRSKPMTTLPALFAGAFLAHHRFVKKEVIEKIYENLTNKTELIGMLAEMYSEPINAFMDEPEEKEGNLDWTANW